MFSAALAAGLVAVPAAPALASDSGSVQPPSPTGSGFSNGLTYTSSIGGDTVAGGTAWTPPACWMQPFFPQTRTYEPTDPSGSQSTDADSYYSWFVSQGAPATQTPAQEAAEFKDIQERKDPAGWTGPSHITAGDIWWAPNWLANTTGFACAEGLVAANRGRLSNTYLGLEPPLGNGQSSTLTGAISPYVFSRIALAQITLPKISIVTSPPGTQAQSAVVNTPTYVAVDYQGRMDPSKTKTAFLWGQAPIWASVQATVSSVTVSYPGEPSPAPTEGFGEPNQACAAVNGQATSACSITFASPSSSQAPDNVTVTVTWNVTWSTSGGTGGTLNSGTLSAVKSVAVDEIQSQS